MVERVVKALAVLLVAAIVLRIVAWLVTPVIPVLVSLLGAGLIVWWLVALLLPPRGGKQ